MREIETAELKQLELDILTDIHNFCTENGITYFLWGGTLLGAIRHNGFIPWDDDIDIAMPRKDYIRFMNSYYSERYRALSCETERNYPYCFGKVIDTHTVKIEPIRCKIQMGVDVDVFPIDDAYDECMTEKNIKNRQKMLRLWSLVLLKGSSKNVFKKIAVELIRAMAAVTCISANRIARKVNQFGQKASDTNGKMLFADSNIKKPLRIESSWISKFKAHSFENGFFPVPIGYDALLRACYGDYMQLPPEEKRVTHHSFKAYRK